MTTSTIAHPPIVSRDLWLVAHKELLTKENELTRHRNAVNAERRRLPMVRIDTDYVFEGLDGKASLPDLFDGRRQLIIYHFMFHQDRGEGCEGCSLLVENTSATSRISMTCTSLQATTWPSAMASAVAAEQEVPDISDSTSLGCRTRVGGNGARARPCA